MVRRQRRSGIRAVVRTVPKQGRRVEENEDSTAADPSAGRFAVADGVSTSARAEVWSRLLVDAFVDEALDPTYEPTLTLLRHRWWSHVMVEGLPWYAEQKLLDPGGQSTFAGLVVDPTTMSYQGLAVGDACVFQVRGGRLLAAAPITHSQEFSRFASAVTTRHDVEPVECVRWTGGYRRGDTFVLATDALAKFFLARYEAHHRVPAIAPFVSSPASFARRIARYRRTRLLDNDDTTVCVVMT